MDPIPNSAIAMAIGLLIIIWAFFVHMMMNQADDAHLQLLLDLVGEEEQLKNCLPPGSFPCVSNDHGMKTLHETAQRAADEAESKSMQYAWREVPLLFTMSLRGRGL